MGYLMDAIAYRISRENSLPSQPEFETELRRLAPHSLDRGELAVCRPDDYALERDSKYRPPYRSGD